jgi:hypothetical protein
MVLEHPGGGVLRMLLQRGRVGTCTHPRPEVMDEAIRQLERWGFAEFSAEGRGRWSYRVTALGAAADRWGFAKRVVGDTRVSPSPR